MDTRGLVTTPITIDYALIGRTAVESAGLRERHVLPVIVDANVLIEDVLHRIAHPVPTLRSADNAVVLHPKPSALSHLLAIHAIRAYGKPDLLEEVAEHLPYVAARKGHDTAAAFALIAAEYAPHMRLVDPGGIVLPASEDELAAVARVDPDDEPMARLSRLLDPSILLTMDRASLLAFGFGEWVDDPDMDALITLGGGQWLKATLTLRNASFMAHLEVGGRAVTIPGQVVADATRKAVSFARENPVPTALALGALLVVLYPTRDSPFWSETRASASRAVTATLDEIVARTEGRPQAALRATSTLGVYLAKHKGQGMLVTDLARALAIAGPEGLTAADLYHITGHRGPVLPILERHRAFAPNAAGRWHLGRGASG